MKKLLIMILLLIASPAFCADHYFDATDGSDAGAGTSGDPWQTLSKVATECGSGDTCYFAKDETWTSATTLITCAENCTYDGDTYEGLNYSSGDRAILRITSAPGSPYCMVEIGEVDDVYFNGFELDGNDVTTSAQNWGIAVGGYVADASFDNINIDNCVIHDTTNRGIYVGPQGSSSITISNVTVTNTEVYYTNCYGDGCVSDFTDPADGCTGSCSGGSGFVLYPEWDSGILDQRVENLTITNCSAHHNVRDGFYLKDDIDDVIIEDSSSYNNRYRGVHFETHSTEAETDVQAVTIRRCAIYNNGAGGVDFQIRFSGESIGPINFYNNIFYENTVNISGNDLDSSYYLGSSTVNILNNTFYNSGNNLSNGCVDTNFGATCTVTFRNNIIYTANDRCLYDVNGRIDTHSNNLFYRSSGTGDSVANIGGSEYDRAGGGSDVTEWEASAQKTDPLFVTPGSNFDIQSGSDCIDAGYDLSGIFTTDYHDNNRDLGPPVAFDIGADEYGAGGDTPTITGVSGVNITLH